MNKKRLNQLFIMLALALLFFPLASAKQEYAVKESRNCPYCHTRDGPPQLNEIGAYYAKNNHSLEGYVPAPKVTPTPTPAPTKEIGVHMNTWDVGIRSLVTILLLLAVVFIIRL